MTVSAKKYEGFLTEMEVLGHIVSQEGTSVCPDRMDAYKGWP